MRDDNDVKIKKQWQTDPFHKNSPCMDPEKECDNFCKAFCEAFCDEFCGEFLAGMPVYDHHDSNEGGEASNNDGFDNIPIVVENNNGHLDACREICCRICRKVCRKVYWEQINRCPMA